MGRIMVETVYTELDPPFDRAYLQRYRKKIRRTLKQNMTKPPLHLAILGGSTTHELAQFLEIFLLHEGINVEIYESDYNQFYGEAVFENSKLNEFNPSIIYLHTSCINIPQWPKLDDTQVQVNERLEQTLEHFKSIWMSLSSKYRATIIQNNFELPFARPLGNLDGTAACGRTRFVRSLNERFAECVSEHSNLIVHDLNYLSSQVGLQHWYDQAQWYAYKYAMNSDAFPDIAHSVAAQVKATLGLGKKAVICDLDNTLWGGVIGDDGVEGIKIGEGNSEGEAYSHFQRYLKNLHERGVLLAVCSKNEPENAKQGFSHPDSTLSLADFAVFEANWNNKDGNIEQIAKTLNIGLDALVFLDDNPSERALVRERLPMVCVPDIGSDVTNYLSTLDRAGLFELVSLNPEDMKRSKMYEHNIQRSKLETQFADYGEFLKSLHMEALIKPFDQISLPRITQLTNKTNQFNLTTQRYGFQEMESFMHSDKHLTLYGRLKDKFGDNGIVSVVLGEQEGEELHLHLWLMSCRVFKRDMEQAMFLCLKEEARQWPVTKLVGHYIPSKKNGLVSMHYQALGFSCVEENDQGKSTWEYPLSQADEPRDIPITLLN
ncbi:HAD-IIIC family phosphatase [Flexibacterium corallicola]|uniref:HAD-IIIC family phosphatase n=1 Tax=Flexibacterium corallicola TaxID=3037259 RepID=UPI00286F9500|nr:HAD-IIIC family phosphatase [Pseudovibrio sp. M1P-2-3]